MFHAMGCTAEAGVETIQHFSTGGAEAQLLGVQAAASGDYRPVLPAAGLGVRPPQPRTTTMTLKSDYSHDFRSIIHKVRIL